MDDVYDADRVTFSVMRVPRRLDAELDIEYENDNRLQQLSGDDGLVSGEHVTAEASPSRLQNSSPSGYSMSSLGLGDWSDEQNDRLIETDLRLRSEESKDGEVAELSKLYDEIVKHRL